jgi:hypothetical protein
LLLLLLDIGRDFYNFEPRYLQFDRATGVARRTRPGSPGWGKVEPMTAELMAVILSAVSDAKLTMELEAAVMAGAT